MFLLLIFVTVSRSKRHSAVERIMSMKSSIDIIRNQTRYLPSFIAVPYLNATPRASVDKQFLLQIQDPNRCSRHETASTLKVNPNRLI